MPYVGKKPADIIATAVDTTTGTFSGAFTSLGIDDNADANAITIDSSEQIGIGTTSPSQLLHLKSTTNAKPNLLIETENAGANGGRLDFLHKSSSPADGDLLGDITFGGYSDDGTPPSDFARYVMMKAFASDVSNNAEKGKLVFSLHDGASNENNVDVVTIDGQAVSMSSTLAVGGVLTANAGVAVDNITIDGTEIDLSSGDLTVDVAGDITLDAGGGDILFEKAGTTFLKFTESSGDAIINQNVSDKDIKFNGNDGGSGITALSLDMSEAGRAAFNSHVDMTNSILIFSSMGTNAKCIQTTASGSHSYTAAFFRNSSGTEVGSIGVTTSGSSFNTSSDYRLKENVNYSFDATTRLKQLKPARFNFIVDADTTVDGFIAHEVSSIVPEAITGEKDATEDIKDVVLKADGTVLEDNISENKWIEGKADKTYADDTTWVASKTVPKYQSIDQAKLVPLLTKALQEQQATIEALTARIVTLENA